MGQTWRQEVDFACLAGEDDNEYAMNDWKTGKTAVIQPKTNRKQQREVDEELYKARHPIENFFATLKQFRSTATRSDKTTRNFLAAVYFAAVLIWLV